MINKYNKYILIFLILISLMPLFSLFHPGLPVTHDGKDHVARIANFYQSLSEGNIVPRWAGNLNWGYGHPVLMFLYPLPSYLASVFKFLGFGFVDSTKIVFGLSFTLSTLTMYLWLSKAYGKAVGFLGAILYGFAPYRFVDLYVRGAIGEHVAFIFPPLICFFIYEIYIYYSHIHKPIINSHMLNIGLSFSVAGLILSHNALSLMFLPVCFLYALYLIININFKKNRIYFLLAICFHLMLGFGLSSFFWIPALLEGKYTLRNIVMSNEIYDRFLPLQKLFNPSWNYGIAGEFPVFLGFPQFLALVLSVFVILKIRLLKYTKLFILILALLLIFSLYLMTGYSLLFWKNIPFLDDFQFPWRFMSLSVFLSSILSALVYELIFRRLIKNKNLFNKAVIFTVMVIVVSTYGMWQPKAYSDKSESFYSGIFEGTTDTGESSPIWSVRFMERIPVDVSEVISGDANIQWGLRNSTTRDYTIIVESDKSRILENTLYFPGWKIYSDKELVNPVFQDPEYRGLMTYTLNKGNHDVKIIFGRTKLRIFAETLSVLTFAVISVMIFRSIFMNRDKIS